MDRQAIKLRFGIIGNNPMLNRALDIATQVAVTDMSVLITGESGVGKEVFSKIIHQLSPRKHAKNIAVNCGAIPEGTIESELFGHVKGSFTSADKDRKGYFEEADGGTIFLDEVAELPLQMQAKLLRVLETGEFLKVGSSKPQKADVRVVAATNVDIPTAIQKGKFREDLYFRLNQISILIPPLRKRKEDIELLFLKFASDIAEKYHMPTLSLTDEAKQYLTNYPWYGNVRELKNVTEQMSVIERERIITKDTLAQYISEIQTENLPVIYQQNLPQEMQFSERELLLKALNVNQMLLEMRSEINDLKTVINTLLRNSSPSIKSELITQPIQEIGHKEIINPSSCSHPIDEDAEEFQDPEILEEEPISLQEREKKAIKKALDKNHGKRKLAAQELGISERTLYRKLKEYDIL